jgi:hypothetical protein
MPASPAARQSHPFTTGCEERTLEAMWRFALVALALTITVTNKPASVKADLVFLTRDGCVNTPDMTFNAMTTSGISFNC